MKHITASAFKEVVGVERDNSSVDFINVCTPAEYKEKHIPGVRSVPLDDIERHMHEFGDKKTIYVHCRSGRRGAAAIEKLASLGVKAELVNVEGGLLAWEEAGYETGSHTSRMPLMRQVFVAAGALICISSVLALTVHSAFVYIPLFASLGLLVSGFTGWCGMALLLARMPWNK